MTVAYVDPRSIKPVTDRLVGEALAAINAATPAQGVAVADAVDDTDIVVQFNALLASLRDSGAIAT